MEPLVSQYSTNLFDILYATRRLLRWTFHTGKPKSNQTSLEIPRHVMAMGGFQQPPA
jgi:hypothetical protein